MKPIQGHNLLKLEVTMEIKIQSIHFDATEKLQAFIEKKIAKLEKTYEDRKSVGRERV